ncbi:hypothetical protein M0R04_11370 [Candidatus Dojkabacteria bacterium]|jgi:uncharacterized C2H2 Zn-finger protein|nr:hypothetical protein [Candidatus Dojkabacteria bacterium]
MNKEDMLKCPRCGKKYVPEYDSIAKKVTGHLFKPTCKCYKDVGVMIG